MGEVVSVALSLAALLISYWSYQQSEKANHLAEASNQLAGKSYNLSEGVQLNETQRVAQEQVRNEYLAHKLGKYIAPITIKLKPVDRWQKEYLKKIAKYIGRPSERVLLERVDYLQGIADQLRLPLELKTLFLLPDGRPSGLYGNPYDILRKIKERILEIHNIRVAASFTLGSELTMLHMYPRTIREPNDKDAFVDFYHFAVFKINPSLEVLGIGNDEWLPPFLSDRKLIEEQLERIQLRIWKLWYPQFEITGHMYRSPSAE